MNEQKLQQRQCSVKRCGESHLAKGYCRIHYRRWRRYGRLHNLPRQLSECRVRGCNKKPQGHNLCPTHYARWYKHGDLRKRKHSCERTHGLSQTKLYRTFLGIRVRCSNPNFKYYGRYGGRGIKCLWKSFEDFRDDMMESYSQHIFEFGKENTTIERVDNDGHYCKENCKWATKAQQAENKSGVHRITHRGETRTLTHWCRKYRLPVCQVGIRIREKGMSFEEAAQVSIDYQLSRLRKKMLK